MGDRSFCGKHIPQYLVRYMGGLLHHSGGDGSRWKLYLGGEVPWCRGRRGFQRVCHQVPSWRKTSPLLVEALHRGKAYGCSSRDTGSVLAVGYFQRCFTVSSVRDWSLSHTVEKGARGERGSSRTFDSRCTNTKKKGREWRENKRGSTTSWIRYQSSNEGPLEVPFGRYQTKGAWKGGRTPSTPCRGGSGSRWHGERRRSRAGWFRLCTNQSGRRTEDQYGNGTGIAKQSAGEIRALSGEDEGEGGGYKRYWYSKFERTIDRESDDCFEEKEARAEKEEEEKGWQQSAGSEVVGSDPYGEIWEEGEEEEKLEETEEIERWSDSKLQHYLRRGGISGEPECRDGRGPRSSYEEEEQRQTRECAGYAHRAHPKRHGTVRHSRHSGRGDGRHKRDQGGELFPDAREAAIPSVSERAARDALAIGHPRPVEDGGCGESGGQFVRPLHGTSSIDDRPRVEYRPPHGAPQYGRDVSGISRNDTGFTKAFETGRKGARKRVELSILGRTWQRTRQARLERRPRRCQGRKRKRQEREERKVAEPRQLGEKGSRVGQDERERGREVRRKSTLARAVENSTEDVSTTIGTVSFGAVLLRCTTIYRTGCALAWCLCNIKRMQELQGNSMFVRSFIANSGVWHKGRRSRQALPICEGDFVALREVSQKVSLEEATSEDYVRRWHSLSWELLSCVACNFLVGAGGPLAPGKWCAIEKALATSVSTTVCRFETNDCEHVDFPALEKELVSKRVSYTGEEFGVCNPLSLRQILPALPPKEHGGVIDVLELVSPITRDLLLHPEKLEIEDVGQEFPKLQGRVHVRPGELDAIADELVTRGVCMWFPLRKVKHVRGSPVLNGLFGVPKQTILSDGTPVLRLIMNLIPGNAITKQIRGSVRNLPHITAWLSTFVEEGEQIQLWQSDMSNAFYLFKIPQTWAPYLSFNVKRIVDGGPAADGGEMMVLACRVLPVGWASSVGVMQEISERLLWMGRLPRSSQLVRSRAVPLWMVGLVKEAEDKGKAWWHVYLDNFAAGEVVKDGFGFEGDRLHIMAEDAWERAGVLSSEKKKKKGVASVQELGAYIDGSERTIGPSGERVIKLLQGTLWLLGRRHLSKKLVQVIAGRWVHIFQFRRPAMAFLEEVWAFGTSMKFDQNLVLKVRIELLHCIFAMPLLHTFLGAEVTKVITASDASSTGGAVGISRELEPPGRDFVQCQRSNASGRHINVLVISLFNGVGGAFRCYDVLGLVPLHMVAFDIHGPAQRITSRRWPQAELHGDVRKLDRSMVERWLTEYPEIEEIHLWGGFPCVDLSSVNVRGEGLEGKQSSLFYEIPRIKGTLREFKPPHVILRFAIENVASMPKSECSRISNILDVYPYHLDCSDAVPMRRPRLCWCSEAVGSNVDGIQVSTGEFWYDVEARAEYPSLDSWISPGSTWPGYEEGFILPTAMKSIKRVRPPPGPAGMDRCDPDTLARWQCDEYRFPPISLSESFHILAESTMEAREQQ